ncbi:MAG: hypothetical protein AABY79_10385 [Nitrospirota bacterium]
MRRWNNIKEDLKKGIEGIKSRSKRIIKQIVTEIDILKLKYEREKIKKELTLTYQKIGEKVFDMAAEGKKDILKDPELNKLFGEIYRLEESEKMLSTEILETREYLKEKKGV